MNRFKKIGIISGMGPEAGAELYKRIIRKAQVEYGSWKDEDFPEMIIVNLPISDILNNPSLTREQTIKSIQSIINMFELYDVGNVAIACNTAHIYFDNYICSNSIKLFNLIEETKSIIEDKSYNKSLVLASSTTIKNKLYQNGRTISVLPEDQKTIDLTIESVLKGQYGDRELYDICNIIKKYQIHEGIDAAILGCTDLPLIGDFSQKINIKIIDTLEVLTDCLLEERFKND